MSTAIDVATVALVIVATHRDLRTREIPDSISLGLLAIGLTAALAGWSSLTLAGVIYGVLVGFVVSAPLFYLGGLGGGDVKLIAALGSILGPVGILTVLFWMAIAGGVLAVIAKYRGQTDFAYVPAILFGLCVTFIERGGMG